MHRSNCRLVVSIDTEEDIWGWSSRAPITCANVKELPRLARFLRRYRIRPTFFASYQVMSDASATAVLRELAAEEGFEIGCHVHPWNTPPFDGSQRRTVLHNLPRDVQAAKIATVSRLFEEVFDHHPDSFRAGRFGFGPATAECLIEQGYRVDSSVTPFLDWTESSHGQNYVGAPLKIYRLHPRSGVFRDDPDGPLLEVPLTSGFTRLRPDSWAATARLFDHPAVRAVHLPGIAARLLAFKRVILSPESHTVSDMVSLARRVVQAGVGHLHLFFHSSSLVPGLTPFTRTSADVERLYDRMEELLDRLQSSCELEFASVSEAAALAARKGGSGEIVGSEGVHAGLVPGPTGTGTSLRSEPGAPRWFGPRGMRARLGYLGRYAYAKVGGYRRYRRVRWSEVKRLVFVCAGNICRSPYAEQVARAQGMKAVSVGVATGPDGAANPTALRVGLHRGVSLDEHRTTPLDGFQPREGDLFIAMEPFQAALVARRRWPVRHQITLLGFWAGSNGPVIPDPYGGDEWQFSRCFSVIDRGIASIGRRLDGISGGQPHGSLSAHGSP